MGLRLRSNPKAKPLTLWLCSLCYCRVLQSVDLQAGSLTADWDASQDNVFLQGRVRSSETYTYTITIP